MPVCVPSRQLTSSPVEPSRLSDLMLARREGWIWAPGVSTQQRERDGVLQSPLQIEAQDTAADLDETPVAVGLRETARCLACARGLPKTPPRVCPECGRVFSGTTWAGIDGHWKSRHNGVMPYEQFWESLCLEHRGRRPSGGGRVD